MCHEDILSRQFRAFEKTAMEARNNRRKDLLELYTPFVPYFNSTDGRTDDSILMRIDIGHRRRARPTMNRREDEYTVPHAIAILESPSRELYASRASRKFESLLGLPFSYQRRTVTPTHRKRYALPALKEGSVPTSSTHSPASIIKKRYVTYKRRSVELPSLNNKN